MQMRIIAYSMLVTDIFADIRIYVKHAADASFGCMFSARIYNVRYLGTLLSSKYLYINTYLSDNDDDDGGGDVAVSVSYVCFDSCVSTFYVTSTR